MSARLRALLDDAERVEVRGPYVTIIAKGFTEAGAIAEELFRYFDAEKRAEYWREVASDARDKLCNRCPCCRMVRDAMHRDAGPPEGE